MKGKLSLLLLASFRTNYLMKKIRLYVKYSLPYSIELKFILDIGSIYEHLINCPPPLHLSRVAKIYQAYEANIF